MTKEDIQNRIEQVAYDGATDGYNQAVIEREAEKLATELVKLFAIPDVVGRSEQLPTDIEIGKMVSDLAKIADDEM